MNEISPSLGRVKEGSTWQSLYMWTVKDLLCDAHSFARYAHTPIQPPHPFRILCTPTLRGILLPGNEEEGGGKAGAAAAGGTVGHLWLLLSVSPHSSLYLSAPQPPQPTFTSSHTVSLPPSSETGVSVIPCLLPVNSPTPLHPSPSP